MPYWYNQELTGWEKHLREQQAKRAQDDIERELLQPFTQAERERLRDVRRDFWLGNRFSHMGEGFPRLFVRWLISEHRLCECHQSSCQVDDWMGKPIPPSYEAA